MKTPSFTILIVLSVVDSLVLVLSLPDQFLEDGFGVSVRHFHAIVCRLYEFVTVSLEFMSIYLIITFTIFRVIAVYLPHKANVYCSRRRTWMAIALVIICSFILNIMLVTQSHIPSYDSYAGEEYIDCHFTIPSYVKFQKKYGEYYALVTKAFIPFATLVLCNSAIIYKVIKLKQKRWTMTNATRKSDDSLSMSLMLIAISVLFIATQAPVIISSHIERNMNYDNLTPEYIMEFWIMETALRLLFYINYVANFFCYCISGRKFRQEFLDMLREWNILKKVKDDENVPMETVSTVA